MKKIILILLLFSFYFGYTQTGEVKPITCKQLQTPNNVTFYFNIGDSAFWARLGSYGEMRIISKYYADRYLVSYNNANRDVDLNTHSIIAKGQNLPLHIGVAVMPTHIKNVDGTVTLGNDGVFNFSKNADGSAGIIQKAITSSSTITLSDGVVNYIYADYSSSTPTYTSTLDNTIFKDNFTKIPVIRATREGTTIHFEEYDLYGILLANKLMIKDIYINGGRRWTGLILSTIPTRKSIVSSGSAIFAVQYYDNMPENIAGTSGLMYEYYLSSGVWNKIQRTSYDATYYSDGVNRLSLNNSYWVSKYFWRDIGDDNEVYFIHGNQYNKESDAINELKPAAPSVMTAHTVYVGKIVIQKDALNGTAYPRVWEDAIQNSGVRNHSDLSQESLVWNKAGHTGTINTIAGFDSGGLATNVTLTKESVGLGNVTNDAQVKRTEMGANNGVATLDVGGKVPMSQLPASLMIYKGIWSALTNTPTLTDGVGTAGWVYKNNLAGTVNFGSGPISFYPGDWVIYNGSTWERSVGTDNVVSVNGQQGIVVLNTSHITENTNLYFTDTRAQAAVVEDQINDGVTNKSPSENVVFDALAGKAPSSGSTSYIWNGVYQVGGNFNIGGSGTSRNYFFVSKDGNNYQTLGGYIGLGNASNANQTIMQLNATSGLDFWNYNTTRGAWLNTFKLTEGGAATFAATVQATTAKLTNLSNGYIPYHISDASGLGNSPIYTDGTNVGINTVNSENYKLAVNSQFLFNGKYNDESRLKIYTDSYSIYYESPFDQIWNIGGSERMRSLASSGNVGIGYSTGTEITNNKLAVNGSGYFNGKVSIYQSSAGFNQFITYGSGAAIAENTYSTSSGVGAIINSYQSSFNPEYIKTTDVVSGTDGYSNMRFIVANNGIFNTALKLNTNASAVFSNTVNSIGYLLNGNNLFSSLSSGYLPYWDGTKLVNSEFSREWSGYYVLNGTHAGIQGRISNSNMFLLATDNLVSGKRGNNTAMYIYGDNRFDIWVNTALVSSFGSNYVQFITDIKASALSGTGTRLTTVSSDGTLGTLANGTGFLKNNGAGTWSYDSNSYALSTHNHAGVYEPAFSKNTAFNKNFGTTAGTVLEGRTFGTAANNNTGDFEPFNNTIYKSRSPIGTNLNNQTAIGYYPIFGNTSADNNPVDEGYGSLVTISEYYPTQLWSQYSGDRMFFRGLSGGIWSTWKELWHSGNFNPSNYAPASGSGSYIQNGTSQQTANYNVSGYGIHGDYIQATTAKLTNLSDGYIPYHISDASGLGNSPIYTDGTNIGIGTTSSDSKLSIQVSELTAATTDAISFRSNSGALSKIQSYNAGNYYQDINFQTSNGISSPSLNTVMTLKGQTGNVGIGYSTGTEITNNKLAVNGSAYFNGTIKKPSSLGSITLETANTTWDNAVNWYINNETENKVAQIRTDANEGANNSSRSVGLTFGIKKYGTALGTITDVLSFHPVTTNATFSGTVNSTGYLLNGNNLFSSLSTNAAAKWDGTKFINLYNPTVQTLSGTTTTYDIQNGIDAKITISGNTSITMQNLIEGNTGVIYITNPSTSYKLKIMGYSLNIAPNLSYDVNGITLKGSSTPQSIGWKYIAGVLLIHSTYYSSITY